MAMRLRFRYTYRPLISGPRSKERAGQLHIYVGGTHRQEAVRYDVESSEGHTQTVSLTWPADAKKAAADDIVHFYAFVFVRNFKKQWALEPAGHRAIPVQDFREGDSAPYPLTIPQAGDVVKGSVQIHWSKWTGPPPPSPDLGVPKDRSTFDPNWLDADMDPSWPILQRVRVPIYQCTDFTLPGRAYCLTPLPVEKPDPAYYANALRLSLRRFAITEDAFLSGTPDVQAGILAQVVCLYPSTCTYVTDKVWLNRGQARERGVDDPEYLMEQFGCETARNAGDCEDGALSALQTFIRLKHADFASPALSKLIEVAQHYVGFICLKGVTAPALAHVAPTVSSHLGKSDDSNHGITGSHMDCMLFPRHTVRAFLTGMPGADVLVESPLLAPVEGEAAWPILVCEPTGKLHPTGGKLAMTHTIEILQKRLSKYIPDVKERRHLFRGATFVAVQPRTEDSPFYRAGMLTYTPEFVWSPVSLPYAEFVFVDRKAGTYGVDFAPLVQGDADAVGLRPAPPLDADAMYKIERLLLQGYPSAVLHPGPCPRIENALKKLDVAAPESRLATFADRRPAVMNMYFTYDVLTAEHVGHLGAALKRLLPHFMHIEMYAENIRANMGNLVISFFV